MSMIRGQEGHVRAIKPKRVARKRGRYLDPRGRNGKSAMGHPSTDNPSLTRTGTIEPRGIGGDLPKSPAPHQRKCAANQVIAPPH
jgi:hypothetical protein